MCNAHFQKLVSKKMAHICGKPSKRQRLISTNVEAYAFDKNIGKDDVNEIYFEHPECYLAWFFTYLDIHDNEAGCTFMSDKRGSYSNF